MKKFIILAALLAAGSTATLADDLSTKAMKDAPGVTGNGATTNPVAKPDSGSLSEKAMKDAPGVTGGGTTAAPTAKPDSGSLSEKAMQDQPGVNKP